MRIILNEKVRADTGAFIGNNPKMSDDMLRHNRFAQTSRHARKRPLMKFASTDVMASVLLHEEEAGRRLKKTQAQVMLCCCGAVLAAHDERP